MTNGEQVGDSPVLEVERGANPRVLLLAFTGLASRFHMIQPFDFFRLAGLLKYSRILLRDPYNVCYLKGIDRSGFDGLVNRLRAEIAALAPQKTIMMGVSAGGYASLLFGSILKPDYVHSFSPYTYLGFRQAFQHADWQAIATRWRNLAKQLFLPRSAKSFFDIAPFVDRSGSETRYNIHACGGCSDAYRALRLRSRNTRVFLYPCATHNVTWGMLKSRCLQEMLQEEYLERADEVYRRHYPDYDPTNLRPAAVGQVGTG